MKNTTKEITLYIIKSAGNLILSDEASQQTESNIISVRGRIEYDNGAHLFRLLTDKIEYLIAEDSTYSFAPYLKAAAKNKSCLQVVGRIQ